MKTNPYLLVPLLAAAAVLAQAQQNEFVPPEAAPAAPPQTEQIKYTLLKPQDKTSETVKETDRNPFGKSETEKTDNQKGSNEENQIRDRLVQLEVVGASPGARGLRVMVHVVNHPAGVAAFGDALPDGVITDYRPPDMVRFGPAPLYTRFTDVWDAIDRLRRLCEVKPELRAA